MDRNTFAILCELLKTRGGLLDDGNVTIEEQVAIFINILAHHTKNRTIQVRFYRSGETISRYIHRVLRAILLLEDVLLVKPTPIMEDCTDSRWKWFKGCLGAIDGTCVEVTVPESDKPRYRTRKGHIATNVLGVCTRDLKFFYVLAGWEGSATDSRILRDAVTRQNGLQVPPGKYYLADAGYINGEGFLAPYRGTRYHLREWENEDVFATEGQTVPDVSNMPPSSSLPKDGEGSTIKRKRNDMIDLSKLVQETKNEIHEATNQMKKLVSVISSSTPEMDGIGEELKRMGFGVMDIVHITMYFGDKPTQYRVWKTLDYEIKLEFARATLNANM